ncbi:MAG: substrate-binding domain-containing protein [Lachnospiraceae bacterium]|nr:substrate-binding domain-containing protein [Lachnospiraceae bacterium]
MAATIKQIAEEAGVSRGTVDRVLNKRGSVNKETAEKIKKVARKLGYKPNIAGRALAAKKKKYTIGVILCSEGIEFFDDVLHGISVATDEVKDYGIHLKIRTMKGYDALYQLRLIRELEEEDINFLIINAINDKMIKAAIDGLKEKDINVITINTDIEGSSRLCYVGSDYLASGETAAGVLGLITGGNARVAIAGGSAQILGHLERCEGFKKALERYDNMEIVCAFCTEDEDERGYDEMKKALKEHPEINAVYIGAAGHNGVCKAILEEGRNDIAVVGSDLPPSVKKLIQNGSVKATICQQPYTQGYKAVVTAMRYLVNGLYPEKDKYIMKNEIKIFENL